MHDRPKSAESSEAADVLVRHLFASATHPIGGLAYGIDYRLAVGRSGGDIVDAFPLADGTVAIVVADIAGKGPQASVQAALVKHSLRAYASVGMSPGGSLVALDRLYAETNGFERQQSFVTAFVGRISAARDVLVYASAGHDVVAIAQPGAAARLAEVTAGAIGILPEFEVTERSSPLVPGALLVLATDGVSEARSASGFFGLSGFLAAVDRHGRGPIDDVARLISDDVTAFSAGPARDDRAILAVRIGSQDSSPTRA